MSSVLGDLLVTINLLPFLSGLECEKLTDYFSKMAVVKALRTSLASMQYGNEDFLADLIAEACSKSWLSHGHKHSSFFCNCH